MNKKDYPPSGRSRSTPETRRRHQRPRTEETALAIPGIFRPPSVQVEVRKFNLYGTLRKSHTEIHNTLPSPECMYRRERERERERGGWTPLLILSCR